MKYLKNILLIFLFSLLLACTGFVSPALLELELSAHEFEFSIDKIEAVLGQTISISVTNDGSLDHNFLIEEFEIDVDINPGETITVTFEANQVGDIQFICNVPGHSEAGMLGIITITE